VKAGMMPFAGAQVKHEKWADDMIKGIGESGTIEIRRDRNSIETILSGFAPPAPLVPLDHVALLGARCSRHFFSRFKMVALFAPVVV